MSDRRDTSPWRSPDLASSTEADPARGEGVWVTTRHAAEVADRTEAWVRRQCRAGRLPCRSDGRERRELVPLGQLLDLTADLDM